ncbi:MAG: rhodanese-like domain-containing protein [Oligoflexia bacterium]|nr:rhodanese-like domain-containing protein [Oligoflexia bacterium]
MSASTEEEVDIIEIDVEKLKRMQMLHVNFLIFDVRAKDDYEKAHIPAALHIPKESFLEKLPQMVPKKDTPIVLYDHDGVHSAHLVEEIEKTGYFNIVNLVGGYQAYAATLKSV